MTNNKLMLSITGEMKTGCEWHEGEESVEIGACGCQECGKMIATKTCETCGEEFLDWSYRGWDDIVAGPAVTSSGDFCCTWCLLYKEREEEVGGDDLDFGWFMV